MRTCVVGDVHGCSAELARVVELCRADRVILVGDLFTKGPDPVGVWRQIREGAFEAVLGNHDVRLLDVLGGLRKGDLEAHAVIDALDETGNAWRDWMAARPLFLELEQFWVVHAGLHPTLGVEETTRRMALTMRRWPDDEPENPYWHQEYCGEKGVIFGHDARRGLVQRRKGGRPYLVGLDTGCVYGGQLSAYVVEDERLVHVPALRVYRPV